MLKPCPFCGGRAEVLADVWICCTVCGAETDGVEEWNTRVSLEHTEEPCPNCKETKDECACMRNKCNRCKKPVGNITFSVCDECWVMS